jgi:hypothetical protein
MSNVVVDTAMRLANNQAYEDERFLTNDSAVPEAEGAGRRSR